MSHGAIRPERGILLELEALLAYVERLAADGDRQRYDTDDLYRWPLHRLWIAVGNEASAYLELGAPGRQWNALKLLRNRLVHTRLPDIDEDAVWRMTTLRPAGLRTLVRERLR